MEQSGIPASKASLSPRAQGRSSLCKKMRGFLGLPGEVRNLIYFYYFQKDYRCEIAAKEANFHHKKEKAMKLCLGIVSKDGPVHKYRNTPEPEVPTTVRISRRLGHYSRVQGVQTIWSTSFCALVLVCKQIHCESLVFLYHNTIFAFNAPSRITNFIQVLPKKNLTYVTRLQLHYTTYGSPRFRRDCIWQEKHLHSWTSACTSGSKKLVNLQELEVWLHVNASPLFFDLRQAWLKPLLQFRRLSHVRKARSEIEDTNDTEPTAAAPLKNANDKLRLRAAVIHFNTIWSANHALQRNAVPALANANSNLHRIFGQAIGRAILGANEEEAMADFKKAWEKKYQQWHHHLGYSYTTF